MELLNTRFILFLLITRSIYFKLISHQEQLDRINTDLLAQECIAMVDQLSIFMNQRLSLRS